MLIITPVRIHDVHTLVALLTLAVPRVGLVRTVGQGEVLLAGQLGLEHLEQQVMNIDSLLFLVDIIPDSWDRRQPQDWW